MARRWSQWPKRTISELNGTSGLAGVGGVILGAVSLAAGPAAIALGIAGGIIVVGSVGYAVVRAIPNPRKSPSELVGQKVDVEFLKDLDPAIRTVAVVGDTQAGKTTLKNRLSLDPAIVHRTQNVSATVISLQTSPPSYIGVLDGGGDRLFQQFEIEELCDCLFIIIDHNISDVDPSVDERRLESHRAFLTQIRHKLDDAGSPPKQKILFLVNKRDLWERSSGTDRALFDRFCREETDKWRGGNRALDLEVRPHSNERVQDVARVMELLRHLAAA
jgi:hypothetical protein